MVLIELNNVYKNFGDQKALDDVSIEIKRGEFIVVQGKSGAGKTTLLRVIAGLEKPDSGAVSVRRGQFDLGMVFQDFSLWPHMTSYRHLGFVLKASGYSKKDRCKRIDSLLEMFSLSDYVNDRPSQLSGGEQQRLAFARAIAPEPEILLLDEPFSNQDRQTRKNIFNEITALNRENGVTIVMATHYLEDYEKIDHRIIMIDSGKDIRSPVEG